MPGASVRSRGNLLAVAPLPPLLRPSGVRHQPQIPYSTAIPVTRPRGFKPLTFGSVASQSIRPNSPKTCQKLDRHHPHTLASPLESRCEFGAGADDRVSGHENRSRRVAVRARAYGPLTG